MVNELCAFYSNDGQSVTILRMALRLQVDTSFTNVMLYGADCFMISAVRCVREKKISLSLCNNVHISSEQFPIYDIQISELISVSGRSLICNSSVVCVQDADFARMISCV